MTNTPIKPPIQVAREMTERYVVLPESDLQLLAGILVRNEVKKGEIIIEDGIICRDHLYIEQGMVRQFYFKNGHDVTEHFSIEGEVVMSIESLYTQVTNHLLAETLEPTIYHAYNYQKFLQLLDQSPGLAKYYRIFQEEDLVITQHKADALRFESAKERYQRFLKEYPRVAKVASLQHIASYLIMTPETLSRVRAGQI